MSHYLQKILLDSLCFLDVSGLPDGALSFDMVELFMAGRPSTNQLPCSKNPLEHLLLVINGIHSHSHGIQII